MTETTVKRKLTAILCADVQGYSRMMGKDEVGTFQTLSDYLELIEAIIAIHSGRVFSSPGDAILAQFDSVVNAVQCAVEIQEKIDNQNSDIPDGRRMQFRIGVNIGDVIEKGSQIYGNGVNIAARLEALADPGGICISKSALEQIEDKLPLGYEFVGEKTVKNIAKPVVAYRVIFDIGDESTDAHRRKHRRHVEDHKKLVVGSKSLRLRPERKETYTKPKKGATSRFHKHFMIFIGVVGFLFFINVFTWHGTVWFHWPALAWGLLLFIHWVIRSKKP